MKPMLSAILALVLSATTLADTLIVAPLSTGGHVAIRIKSAGGVELVGVFNSVTVLSPDVPVPPQPPVPVTKAVRAVILIESEDQTATQATLINQMRNDKAWSKLVTVLDPNQKNESNQPDPQVVALKAAIAGRPLPRLIAINDAGSAVEDVDLPADWNATKAALTAKGVKP